MINDCMKSNKLIGMIQPKNNKFIEKYTRPYMMSGCIR